ncbi:uncharacterized protein [Dermacentor albipictus]|uniref:uncharacterized protein n=1 Tax=Dermacentor albipictus TaxID=60249 RepID=UPI0031FE12F6
MYRSYLCVEVVILLLLSHVGWNGPSSPRVQPCSRAQSRVARQLVRRKVTAVLQRYRVSLGPECPLHPSHDLFWWPAGLMADEAPTAEPQPQPSWNCPMCGRSFFCHEKLTSHWDEEHAPNLPPKADRGVCLADYCDILRCDVLGPRLAAAERASAAGSAVATALQPDKPKEVAPGGRCGEPPADHPRCSCDQKHMSALHQKCRIVVQQCVIGLLSVLSVKDFQDIEDELNNNICSYLTCNKYWDDSLNEERRVPMLFSMIIGIILVGGFCLCYYIVWILFEAIPLPSLSSPCDGAPYDDVYCNSQVRFSRFGLSAGGRDGGPARQCHCRLVGRHAYHKHSVAASMR